MAASPASWALLNWPLEEWQGWNRGARELAYKETSPLPGCVTLVTVTAPGLFICEEGHISPASKNGLRINAAIRWVLRAQFLGDYSPPTPPVMALPCCMCGPGRPGGSVRQAVGSLRGRGSAPVSLLREEVLPHLPGADSCAPHPRLGGSGRGREQGPRRGQKNNQDEAFFSL